MTTPAGLPRLFIEFFYNFAFRNDVRDKSFSVNFVFLFRKNEVEEDTDDDTETDAGEGEVGTADDRAAHR